MLNINKWHLPNRLRRSKTFQARIPACLPLVITNIAYSRLTKSEREAVLLQYSTIFIQSSNIRFHLFADRLEIVSPGAPCNTLTMNSLPLRQAARNELSTSLLARWPVSLDAFMGDRKYFMDKRGEGVPIILSASQKLSGRVPEHRLIDESELL